MTIACLALAVPSIARPLDAPLVRPSRTAKIITYREMVRMWHTPPSEDPSLTAEGRPTLVLEVINTGERVELFPQRDDGGFGLEDLARAAHALRDPRNDEETAADPRLLDLAYRIEMQFDAKAVRIISGFRTPRRRNSRHGQGLAIDVVIPGVKDADVAKFARSIGFVGVGIYPRSGFVHIDSRAHSYFWVDGSGPGQRGRVRQILAKAAAASDAKALERGETPPGENGEMPVQPEGEQAAENQADQPGPLSASISGPATGRRRAGSEASY